MLLEVELQQSLFSHTAEEYAADLRRYMNMAAKIAHGLGSDRPEFDPQKHSGRLVPASERPDFIPAIAVELPSADKRAAAAVIAQRADFTPPDASAPGGRGGGGSTPPAALPSRDSQHEPFDLLMGQRKVIDFEGDMRELELINGTGDAAVMLAVSTRDQVLRVVIHPRPMPTKSEGVGLMAAAATGFLFGALLGTNERHHITSFPLRDPLAKVEQLDVTAEEYAAWLEAEQPQPAAKWIELRRRDAVRGGRS